MTSDQGDRADRAADALDAHARRTHRHIAGPYTGECAVHLGDRCDITAALRHAANIVRSTK